MRRQHFSPSYSTFPASVLELVFSCAGYFKTFHPRFALAPVTGQPFEAEWLEGNRDGLLPRPQDTELDQSGRHL